MSSFTMQRTLAAARMRARIGSSSFLQPSSFLRSVRPIRSRPAIRNNATATLNGTTHVDANLLTKVPKTGFIETESHEAILYFDNVYPLVTAAFDARYLIMRLDRMSIAQRLLEYSFPKDFPIQVKEIIPRIKDGGAFVKFLCPEGMTAAEVELKIQQFLRERNIRPWFNPLRRARCYLVEGRPWLEDLYRFPSTRVKVEFDGPDVPSETLYALFRRFGRMSDIVPLAKDAKDLPRYAMLQFVKIRSATAAHNCMHGLPIKLADGSVTNLRLLYSSTMKTHAIRDWFLNHPRIVLPAAAAILATIAVSIFDPIRIWFIKTHITRSLDVGTKAWAWIKSKTSTYLDIRHRHNDDIAGDLSALLEERKESIEQIQSWLLESAETFIVVQGPRGSGKRELVLNDVLKDWKHRLVLDCEPIQEARGDSNVINAVAQQVGYRPVFAWLNTINSFIDLAAQGTLGTSSGLSETLDTQFNKILHNTATALKDVALNDRSKTDKDVALNDDEYLEAHPEKRVVIVIDNFLHRPDDAGDKIYQRFADWAGALVSSNIAHVIFMTNDISFSKQLAKSLPDRVFKQVLLGDASPEAAKKYVLSHIEAGMTDDVKSQEHQELDASIEELGGRLTDLEFLARRIRAGEMPKLAVNEIIKSSASEILKLYFLGDNSKRKWTTEQAWVLVKLLSTKDELKYNEVLLHGLFGKGEEVLQALEQAEMISIVSSEGRPYAIKAGKPVYRAAFRKLQEDTALKAKMDLDVATGLMKLENGNVAKYEEELSLLGQLPKQPPELTFRMMWLLKKVQKSQGAVEQYESEIGGLKKVLENEF